MTLSPTNGLSKANGLAGTLTGLVDAGKLSAQPSSSGPFTPASLFLNGEIGDYWDAYDLASLFQDSAGTTPVTAAGDPVGLMQGQRGIVDMRQSTSANRPEYTADGRVNLNRSGSAKFFVTAVNMAITGGQNFAIGLRLQSDGGPMQFFLGASGGVGYIFDLSVGLSGSYIGDESAVSISNLSSGVDTSVLANSISGDAASFVNVGGSVTNYTPGGGGATTGTVMQVYPDQFGASITWARGLVIGRDLTAQEQTDVLAWLAEVPAP